MIVLDSHIWYWWLMQAHHRLPAGVQRCIEESPRIGVSPVSCFELALAHRRGRLELPLPPQEWFPLALAGSGIELLPLTDSMCVRATRLTDVHRDPFDRIIIATALELNARLASADSLFAGYPELHGHLMGQPAAASPTP
jgi:PIN domain nuclease of toxin-antitoxin system